MAGGGSMGYGAPAAPQMGGYRPSGRVWMPAYMGGNMQTPIYTQASGSPGMQRFQSQMQFMPQQPNPYFGGWSNPYWRPQPVQAPQMQTNPTGLSGAPISSPPSIVQQYQQLQQARQEQAQTQQNQANTQYYDYTANSGGV